MTGKHDRFDWRKPALSLATFIVLGALLVIAELAVRTFRPHDAYRPSTTASEAERFLEPCARADGSDHLEFLPFLGGEISRVKREPSSDTTRIIVIGESSADQFAQMMRLRLDVDRTPNLELLNCAMPGSGLEHTERRWREVIEYHPHVIVLMFGHNLDYIFPTDRLTLTSTHVRDRSALLAAMHGGQRWVPEYTTEGRTERVRLFRTFLETFGKVTKERGALPIYTTLAPNLWFAPGTKEPETSLLKAKLKGLNGDLAGAISDLDGCRKDDSAGCHFLLGQYYQRMGRYEEATSSLQDALDADFRTCRASSLTNETIRSVAQSMGAPLHDTDARIRQQALHHQPSWLELADNCHLTDQNFYEEAGELLRLIEKNVQGLQLHWSGHPKPEVLAMRKATLFMLLENTGPHALSSWDLLFAYPLVQWLRAEPATTKALLETFFASSEFNSRPAEIRSLFHRSAAEAYFQLQDEALARRHNKEAISVDAGKGWRQLGEFELRLGHFTLAVEAFERAVAQDATLYDAQYYLTELKRDM